MSIFANTTLCSNNCLTVDYVAPQIDLCSGQAVATKKAKVVFFHCNTPNTDLVSLATIQALVAADKARVVYSEEFAYTPSPIVTTVDAKSPDQTIGYNFDITFKDNRWYTSFLNIDQYNEIAAKIAQTHVLFVDQDDEMYLLRTTLGITLLNPYTNGETDKKMIDFSIKGKYFISSSQPHLNKPTVIAGLYNGL